MIKTSLKSVLLSRSALGLLAIVSAHPAFAQEQKNSAEDLVLETILVDGKGTKVEDPTAPTKGYLANSSASAGRVPVPLSETPRSVTVITADQIKDQSAKSLEEIIGYSAGVTSETFGFDSRFDEYAIRGFAAQIGGNYRDGMRLRTYGWAGFNTEVFGIERTEVLRGPTSDVFGANQPGGIVNSISKRPQDEFGMKLQGSYGSHDRKEVAADITGPLFGETSPFTYRLVGVARQGDTQVNEVHDNRLYFAPSLTAQLTDQTKITILAQLQEDDMGESYQVLPITGTKNPNSLGKIGRDTFLGYKDRNKILMSQHFIGYELDHEFSENLKFHQRARYAYTDLDYNGSFNAGGISLVNNPNAINLAVMTKFGVDQTTHQYNIDSSLEYDIKGENFETKLVGGVDFYQGMSKANHDRGYLGEINVFTGAHSQVLLGALGAAHPLLAEQKGYINNRLRQIGLFGVANTKIADRFVIDANLRQDWVNSKTDSSVPNSPQDNHAKTDTSEWTGRIGVSYLGDYGLTPYASYGTSFNFPVGANTPSGEGLKAETSKQFEVGLKFEPEAFNARFNIAAFQATKENVTKDAPAQNGLPAGFYKVQTGEERVRGLEFEGAAELGYGFSALGSYTYLDTEVTKDASFKGKQIASIPQHAGSFWLKYEFQQQALKGLSIAAGLRHLGARYADNANSIKLDPVTLFDGSINYKYNNVELSLSGRNLADKSFIGSCSAASLPAGALGGLGVAGDTHNCTYGKGRELRLQLTSTF